MIDIHNINGYGIEDPGFALLREVAQKYCPEEFQEQRKELFPDEPLNLAAIDKGEDFGIGIPETQKLRDLHYEEADTLNSEQIKKDFPVLNQKVNGHDLVWLDNGATTQKPNQVIDKISDYYRTYNSNIHRGAHTLAARATDAYEEAREKVQRFINAATSEEIIFVRGTTEGINLVAQTYGRQFLTPGDEVIVSELDHHANIVPWQRVCQEKGCTLKAIPTDKNGDLVLSEFERLITPRTRFVSVGHVNNTFGTINDVRRIIDIAHSHNIPVLIDGAQSIAHTPVDVQQLGADFFVFSGHKIYGPNGIGVVYGRKDLLDKMQPWQGGGNMIKDVTIERTEYNVPPARFEAGTPNVADAIGLGAALDYVSHLGIRNIEAHEHKLTEYAREQLAQIPGLTLIGNPKNRVSVVSFVLDGIPVPEVGTLLDKEGIETKILTTKYQKPDSYGALSMPVYYTAAFEFESAKAMGDAFCGRSMAPSYARIANPTTTYLEERVRQLTGATSVTALNTGMTAIHYALTAVSAAGLNIVASKHLFGNSVSLIRDTLGNFGVEPRFIDFTKPDEVEAQIDDKTCALFFEIITNPQLFVADIRKLADIAHKAGVPLIADTTIVPFSTFRAADFGVDIEVVSSTKYISGGGTGLGGLLIDYGRFDWSQAPSPALQARTKRVGKKLAFTARVKTELITNLGGLMTPQVAYMETLGLDTLDIRFRRQAETTLWLARQCQQLPEIKRVNYTGLEDNPFYNLSKLQFGPLPGAVFTIDLESKEAAWAFIDKLQTIRRATNLFDRKSLAIHPASTIFGLFTAEQCAEMSVLDTTVRLSIGLEAGIDLLEDIKTAIK